MAGKKIVSEVGELEAVDGGVQVRSGAILRRVPGGRGVEASAWRRMFGYADGDRSELQRQPESGDGEGAQHGDGIAGH